jgi:hypothetical protein
MVWRAARTRVRNWTTDSRVALPVGQVDEPMRASFHQPLESATTMQNQRACTKQAQDWSQLLRLEFEVIETHWA